MAEIVLPRPVLAKSGIPGEPLVSSSNDRSMLKHSSYIFTPLIVILAFGAVASAASHNETLSILESIPRVYSVLQPGWVIADLDGDDKPDLAQSRQVGRTEDGYRYEIRLKLSGSLEPLEFTITDADALGLELNAIDVDNDDDLDIVVSNRFSDEENRVWLNTGQGTFVATSSQFDLPLLKNRAKWSGHPDGSNNAGESKQLRRFREEPLEVCGQVPPNTHADAFRYGNPIPDALERAAGLNLLRAPPSAPTR